MAQIQTTVRSALPGFIDYLGAERHFSPGTIKKYGENMQWFLREIGDLPITSIGLQHFVSLKARIGQQGAKEARTASLICALKSFLTYARDVLGLQIPDLTKVTIPRSKRREVVYLTKEELEQFLGAIRIRTWMGTPRIVGYRFRALVETLAATGMRISEALSLNRESVDFSDKQAKIIGKGNKERAVFFTDRALNWITRYLDLRTDKGAALFVNSAGERLKPYSVEAAFKRHARWMGIAKLVTPHVIRHTAATHLLQNGCPIGYIKEILGHERLETTCRFYLGILNKADTKKAHERYMSLDPDSTAARSHSTMPPHPADNFSLTNNASELNWKQP
jgi:integrase/recombinase XerD